jgi:cyclopropane fatty-acyl-phospholipid synthase-like methyltransferase
MRNAELIVLVIVLTVLIQVLVTYGYTRTQIFSFRALIRNLSVSLAILFAVKTRVWSILLIPLVLEVVLELLKYNGYAIEPYIATEYQYSDFWFERSHKNPLISNFSEANFDGIMGFNTTDNSPENNKKIYEWAKYAYLHTLNKPYSTLVDMNGQPVPEPAVLKKYIDDKKFELITSLCKIKPGARILEIGFGDGDMMNYIREHYGISTVGLSISNEQVKVVRERGYEAHYMNAWDITPEVVGTYDLVLQLGNIEYILRPGYDPKIMYTKYFDIIKQILKPNGKFFITSCHINDAYTNGSRDVFSYSLDNYLHGYYLWAGNDGFYPYGADGLTKYANATGFKTLFQQERTNDYYLAMNLAFSQFQSYDGSNVTSFSIPSMLDALVKTIAGPYYFHTYLCYLSTTQYVWTPFLWEFTPDPKNGWKPPVTLQYILLQRQ